MSDKITLKIGGNEFNKDWTDMRVIRSLDRLCSSFEFTCTQLKPFDRNQWPLKIGSTCEVLIADKPVLVGYIEDVNVDYTKDSHTVTIAGRDKTCDIVDCTRAPVDKDGRTLQVHMGRDIRISTMIKKLCEPFGIDVVIDPEAVPLGNTAFPSMTVFDPAAPIIEFVMKGCKTSRLIPMATNDGKLLLTVVGKGQATTKIATGYNVIHGGLKQSNKDVFSIYMTKGYTPGTDFRAPPEYQWTQIFYDKSGLAGRYRPYADLSEVPGDRGTGHNRTYWEAHYRAANSRQYGYSLRGLTQEDGSLWEPNMLVTVLDSVLGIEPARSDMLISQVEYTVTNQGSITNLQICSKAKYDTKTGLDSILTIFDSTYAERSY